MFLSFPILGYSRTINRWWGVKKDGSVSLPYARYFKFLAQFKYWDVTNIVYDQLVPSLARYIPKKTLISWLEDLKLNPLEIEHRNNNSYSVLTEPTWHKNYE
jgi:hypothetical protein